MVWLIYSDEELLAAKRNRLAVNRTFSGRSFAGCLPFFRVGQGGVLEKQEASAEEAVTPLKLCENQSYLFYITYPNFESIAFSTVTTSRFCLDTL